MPAKSKAQQQMFGIAHAIQQGKMPASKARGPATDVAKAAKPKDVKDFASTSTKNLPKKVKKKVKKEQVERIREYVTKVVREVLAEQKSGRWAIAPPRDGWSDWEIWFDGKVRGLAPNSAAAYTLMRQMKNKKDVSLKEAGSQDMFYKHQLKIARDTLKKHGLKEGKVRKVVRKVVNEANFEFEWYEQGRWLTKKFAGSKHDADVMLDKIRDRVRAAGESTGNVSYTVLDQGRHRRTKVK